MYIHKADIDHEAATDGDPGSPNPFEVDVAVDQNMEMRVAVLLEFEDSDVLRSDFTLPLQIDPQFGEGHSDNARDRLEFSSDQALGSGTFATGEPPLSREWRACSVSLAG